MPLFAAIQGWISIALGLLALGLQVWAFTDAVRVRPDAFVAAGKRTKGLWLAITGIGLLIGVVFVTGPFNIFSLLAIVAAAVYLTDVRPAVRAVSGRGGGRAGPYGPW